MVVTVTDFQTEAREINPPWTERISFTQSLPVSKGQNTDKTHNTDDPSGYVHASDDHVFFEITRCTRRRWVNPQSLFKYLDGGFVERIQSKEKLTLR